MTTALLEGVRTYRPWTGDSAPSLKTIWVVGAGGIGARLLPTLVKTVEMGTRIYVIDMDRVEPRNLLRQPFDEADIGRFKAEVMEERYATAEIPVIAIPAKVQDTKELNVPTPNVIIGAVDNVAARTWMLEYVKTRSFTLDPHGGSPLLYLDAGNDGNRGQVVVSGRWKVNGGNSANLHGYLLFPEVFREAPPEEPARVGCDLIDTQQPTTNLVAASWLLQYFSAFRHGMLLGSLGVRFTVAGATELLPIRVYDRSPYNIQPEFAELTQSGYSAVYHDASSIYAKFLANTPVDLAGYKADGGGQLDPYYTRLLTTWREEG